MNPIKEIIKKEKQKKKEDKALLKKLEEEERELGIEEDDTKFSFKDFFDILKNHDEIDEELESYLTEEEKNTYREKLKEEKRLTTIIMSVMGIIIVALIGVFIVLNQTGTSELIKTVEPAVKEYYKKNYNSKILIDETYYLKYTNEKNQNVDSKIHITKTKDNKHIIGINKKNFGDDIDIKHVYEQYQEQLKTYNIDLISSSPTISYKDYYKAYNVFYDYIKVLPKGKTYEELIDSKKLTIRDIIFYQGNINFNHFKSLLSKLSIDSKFILIENKKGIPIKLSVLSNSENYTIDITNTTEIEKGITYYELNRNINEIGEVILKNVKKSYIVEEGYAFKNGYTIDCDSYVNKEEQKSRYYFFKFDTDKLELNNISFISTTATYEETYTLLEEKDYPEAYFIKVGGSIYLIGTKEMTFANKYKHNDSFLCKLGLC